jgi:transcriptional regulator GlxA family with amidase domain
MKTAAKSASRAIARAAPRTIAVVIYPGFQILDLAALAAFELANRLEDREVYRMRMLAEEAGPVASSSGAGVVAEAFAATQRVTKGAAKFDTLLMTGGLTPPPVPARLGRFLRAGLDTSRRVASICTGAFALAEAGLLDGRRATTHWLFARDLQERYPRVKVQQDRIFLSDGPVWTSAGMTAGIDLVLALIEEDLGPEIARLIAQRLVVYHRRAGGQSQFSALLELEPKSDRMQAALTYARAHLRQLLSVEELAEVAHLSPRQFSRAFKAETGQSPAHAIEGLRVEAARAMIDGGEHALASVARETGFGDQERMRRAFLRTVGRTPLALKQMARAQGAV